MKAPNILYMMCDQFRFDCISALGNPIIETPNLDRLVKRGTSYTNAYSSCPVCVPARYNIMTGSEPNHTGCFQNGEPKALDGQAETMIDRCGDYLPKTMRELGYRTFGIGKFHTYPDPFEDLGFEVQIHTEELWETPEHRNRDGYAAFIANEHPEFSFIEQLHGERTNMYYQPQMSPLPAALTVENFVAEKTMAQLLVEDDRPFFGYVSFVGPHPPYAPPVPYNRMYNTDAMRNPIHSDRAVDFMDENILFSNHAIWAEDINHSQARALMTRYYGEISYIDACIGKILDVVETSDEAENTIICFFADHGEMLGDHHSWQKGNFFEASTRIPFLVSWPNAIKPDARCQDLVCLTDLFGLATTAAGLPQVRDGISLLSGQKRPYLTGVYCTPGTPDFRIMIREGDWKYIFMANGGREQLFNVRNDPNEVTNLAESNISVTCYLRDVARRHCNREGLMSALEDGDLKAYDYAVKKPMRILQFSYEKNIHDFQVTCENNGISYL